MIKKDKKSIIISTAAFAVLLFFYIKVSHDSYVAEIKKLSSDLAIAKLQQECWDLEANLPLINKSFSGMANASKFIDKIQEVARQSNMVLTSVEPQPLSNQNLYGRASLKLTAVCSYAALGNFISRLEGSNEYMKIDSLKITPVTGALPSARTGAGEANRDDENVSGDKKMRLTEARVEMLISAIYLN